MNLALSDEDADQLFDRYYQLYETSWRLFPEVEYALDALSDHRLGIISNGDQEHQIYKLDRLGILHYFEDIVTPDCAGVSKPGRRIYEVAAARSEMLPGKCWYVGDNYHTDYRGALCSGLKAVWLNRLREPAECDAQCENLLDIRTIVQKNGE